MDFMKYFCCCIFDDDEDVKFIEISTIKYLDEIEEDKIIDDIGDNEFIFL